MAAVAAAAARHTGSLAFPIDDGYIYSNYVLQASQGHFFTYNAGETSGGITGVGWYLLVTLAYWLLAPFHALLGGLAPEIVRTNAEVAQQAGHLYLAAYLPGVVCLAATAVGVSRLARLCLPEMVGKQRAREVVCWLLGAVAAADLGLVWGAMSGLEVSLSAAVAVWAIVLLLDETRRGVLRFAPVLAVLLPWARPDLVAIGGAGLAWLLWRAVRGPWHGDSGRREALRNGWVYWVGIVVGFAAMSVVYTAGWGKPLPSSFYAKVGSLWLSSKFFAAAEELALAGRLMPFVAGGLAAVGGITQWLVPPRVVEGGENARRESSSAALLLLLVSVVYAVALMLTLPWFGQEERYLLPLHPFVIVLLGMAVWRMLSVLPLERVISGQRVTVVGEAVVGLLLAGLVYLWATRVYVVEVRNIADAHIKPALWIADNTPEGSVVASEPIGAVKLFSGRRTVDLVGLTTPATLGTYRDWERAWPALREAGADYLLFYPEWFDGGKPPAWAVERERFEIPDNRIAGADVIAVYEIDWGRFGQAP
jgi:hypothetical protein